MVLDVSNLLRTHEAQLLPLAVIVAVLGSLVTVLLYSHARRASGLAKYGWIFLASVAAGTMTWTTHFVAMLAYDPGCATAYDPVLTSASLFIAIGSAGCGMMMAARDKSHWAAMGGAVVGLGVGAMHYVGMAGLSVAGTIAWNPLLITLSGVMAAGLAGLAFTRVAERTNIPYDWRAALLLAGAVCTLHFTGMAAAVVSPDPAVALTSREIGTNALGFIVTSLALLIVATGLATALIAQHAQRQARSQLRNVADAAVEGLILVEGDTVLDINSSLAALLKKDPARVVGKSVWNILAYEGDRSAPHFEANLACLGELVPVEVISRTPAPGEASRRILAVRDLRERRAAEHRIRYLAHYDTLTGLANRTSFQERIDLALQEARDKGGELALMVLDLDHFKEVNDIFGHAVGDELLRAATRRIKEHLSEDEFAARLGGDEFVVLQFDMDQPAGAARLAAALPAAFQKPLEVGGRQLDVGLSMGVAIYPRDGDTARQLLSNADLALYRAKEQGRGHACFFTADMDEIVRARRLLALELRHAVERNELEVHFQPQASVSTGAIIGFEALARWHHPERGYIPPTEFIGIAEETDLILTLGEWMLRASCREAAGWTEPYRLAVNLSPVQFRQASLPETVASILAETGLDPARLELEITETTLIEDTDRVLEMLRRIRATGVTIAMDDFGTGYSSLSTLQAFPFDKIKIDKSFVAKIGTGSQSTVIVDAVLGLGRSLSIPILAEGVETEEQRHFLSEAACDQAQGYLYGKPMPVADLAHLVRRPRIPLALAS